MGVGVGDHGGFGGGNYVGAEGQTRDEDFVGETWNGLGEDSPNACVVSSRL